MASCLLAILAALVAGPVAAGDFDLDTGALDEIAPPPGTVIDSSNVSSYLGILDPDVADLVGQDWVSITVGAPLSFDPHPAYVKATEQYGAGTRLGDQPGELLDYIAGRPFPGEPDPADPRAGEKLAWNMRYSFTGDSGRIPEMYWHYIDMRSQREERTLEFIASAIRYKHRHTVEPIPQIKKNVHDVYSAITLTALDPADVANTKLLIYYNSDDRKAEQGWMYVPLLRRVRRVATTARTDSFLGSDIMIEDFLGYSGRIMDMDWTYSGSSYVLLPLYRHDQVTHSDRTARKSDYQFVGFHGHSGCFPNVTWQLRKVYLLEGSPKRRDHPIGKRFFYIDAQTMFPVLGKIYDRAGVLWKIGLGGLAHPDYHVEHNRGSGVPMLDSSAMIDLQNKHCTALQMLTLTNVKRVRFKDFEPSALNVGAR